MVNSIYPKGEVAWQLYKNIENVIEVRFEHRTDVSHFLQTERINRALERLCKAILQKYDLKKTDHKKFVYINRIEVEALKKMELSTTESMVNAKIPEWEDAMPPERIPCGNDPDDWYVYEGRTAAYRPQLSLQETLDVDYFTIEAIVNTKPQKAWALYKTIEKVTRAQKERFLTISAFSSSARNKAFEIEKALERLCLAVLHKYKLEKPADYNFSARLDYNHVNFIDLYTIDTMLNAEFMEWESYIPPFTEPSLLYMPRKEGFKPRISLSQALNIARGNPFNFSGTFGPLWGKSTALEKFEEQLSTEEI